MPTLDEITFQHPSEKEFARLLNFYGIRWEYEPRVFPLTRAADGRVLSAFAPDFYLPDQDLYIELTTQSTRLNNLKNRKVRRLQELYPTINIKLLNRRDLRGLAIKYAFPDPAASNTAEGHPRDHA
ncbi:MAG: hypothetical protein HUU23_09755 [Caldilineales bacterium]|nr:hypothetical protein [Caldilineales bacterium]